MVRFLLFVILFHILSHAQYLATGILRYRMLVHPLSFGCSQCICFAVQILRKNEGKATSSADKNLVILSDTFSDLLV